MIELNKFIDFLCGKESYDDAGDVWFADNHPDIRGKFWWRKELRAHISTLEAQLKDREWQVDNPHESILNTVNRGKFLVEVEYIRSSATFTRVETAWFSKSEGWEIDASVQRWMLLPPPYSPKEQDSE